MKRIFSSIAVITLVALVFGSCVTKQKYQELEAQYKKCAENLESTTADKIDFENQTKELGADVEQLKNTVEQLKADTLSLARKLKQSERDYAKARKDYDDLLRDFSEANNSNKAEVDFLMQNLEKTKQELEEKERDLAKKSDELALKSAELLEKEARLNELQSILDQKDAEVRALKDKVADALKGFADSGLNVYEKNGKVYVSMNDKLLFASAKWEIEAAGAKAIAELAKILEADTTINILIEGHTDNVPFNGSGQVRDNWDLSVMRATSVVKAILKNKNIDPTRVSASGRSEYVPIDTENTAEARAKNRRTEIILTPKLDELFKIIGNN